MGRNRCPLLVACYLLAVVATAASQAVSFNAASYTVSEGESVTLRVQLSETLSGNFSITVNITTGSAITADDYAVSEEALTLMFPPGIVEQTVTITAILDREVEGQEQFTVSLTMLMDGSGDMVALGNDTAIVTILDQTVELVFTPTEDTVAEGETASFVLNRTAGSVARDVFVMVSSVNGTAVPGDYGEVSPQTFTFSSSEPNLTVTVDTQDDHEVEMEETFTLVVTSSDPGVTLPSATINITDRTVRIGFAETVSTVDEGSTTSLMVRVLQGALDEEVAVTVNSVNITADGSDYTIQPDQLTFTSTQTNGTVSVTALEDEAVEGEEVLTISLSTGSANALLEPASANVTIRDRTIIVLTSPADQLVAVNSPSSMSCSFTSTNTLTIQWFRDGMAIPNSIPFTISNTSNNSNYFSELTIDTASFAQCGDYHCMASGGGANTTSESATLQVVDLINSSDSTLNFSVGAVANLSCSVRSCGRASIRWDIPTDNGTEQPIPTDKSTAPGPENTNVTTSVATINTVGVIHNGSTQSCSVRDSQGEAVIRQPFFFNLENVAITEMPPPALIVGIGDNVQLNCSAENPPGVDRELLISWHYDGLDGGTAISDNPRYIISRMGNRSVLMINNITDNDRGNYMCAVSNRLEFADGISSTTEITVEFAPTVTFPENLHEIPVGENETITCSTTGVPAPTLIIISRNGVEVNRTTSGTELSYTIEDPMLNDTGMMYSCRAENAIGNTTVSFMLEVEDRPAAVNISTLSSKLLSLVVARLTWTPPNDNNAEITNYTISLCVNISGCSNDSSFRTYTSDSAAVSVEVLPARAYTVRIVATNVRGSSDDSDDGMVVGAMEGNATAQLSVDFITDSLALLSWTLPELATSPTATNPPPQLRAVEVNGSSVMYGIDDNRMTLLLNASADSALLTNLTAGQLYTFILRVDYGEGLINQIARDAMVQATTLDAYEPPTPSSPLTPQSNGILISWLPVENVGDSLDHYEVFVREVANGNRRKRQAEPIMVAATDTSYLFEDDEPFTKYEVSVDGVLDVNGMDGRVQALAATTVTSAEQQPSPPRNLREVEGSTGFTTFVVEWEEPAQPNGVIESYTVRYDSREVDVPSNGQSSLRATITADVMGSTDYEVTVIARNGQPMESDPSNRITVTTPTGVFPPTIRVNSDPTSLRYTVFINDFNPLYGPLSHFFVFVVPIGDPPDTSEIGNDQDDYIAAAIQVGSNTRVVVIGDGKNTTYNGETYISRSVERGTRYYFFIRLFSSRMDGLYSDSEPVTTNPLPEEEDEGASTIAIVGGVLGALALVLLVIFILLLVYALCGSKVRVYKVPRLRRLDDGEGKGGLELRRRTRLFSPVLDVGDPNVFTSADQPTTLICEVSGTPAPTVTWTRGGKPLEDERILVLADHSLFIQDTHLEDQGDYLVTAENSAGTSEALIKVTVLKPTPPEPDLKDHPPVPVDNFPEYHARLSANDAEDLEDEYSEIEPDFTNTSYAAKLPINRNKNRYINIIPYDHSRVVLQLQENTPGSDYVNASYIDGFRHPNQYIATQGPTTSTFSDFWRMIWELDCPTIVMVTKLKEEDKVKCNQYWPSYGSTTYGNVQVTLKEAENLAEYSIRTFSVSPLAGQSNAQMPVREVKQFHFLKWPDHGVPHYATAILHFRKRVHTYHPEKRGPMVVHCSAGVGRTGTFITVDYVMQQMEAEGVVDIYNFVQQMRYKRNYMVQTSPQYVFIHEAINEAITCGDTSIKAPELKAWLTKLEPDPDSGKTTLETQFEHLSNASPKDDDFDCSVAELNKEKNRTNDHLPSNENRVVLSTENDQSDYICASTVDGYRQRNAFMITQGPMKSTVGDFWRMVWEYKSAAIVMLTPLEEEEEEMSVKYWPDEVGQPEAFGMFHVELSSEVRDLGEYSTRKLKLSPVDKAHESRIVTQFHYTKWTRTATPPTAKAMIDMIDELQRVQRKSGNQPITVHCNDGLGRTGTFCTLYYVLDRVKTEQVVDVFQAVKTLRIQRTGLLENKDQYEFVHRATMEFLDTFSDYQNFK